MAFDIRDLISVEDAVEEAQLGQTGKPPLACPRATYTASGCKPDQYGFCRGLLFCMEYLEENLDEWFGEELEVCKL